MYFFLFLPLSKGGMEALKPPPFYKSLSRLGGKGEKKGSIKVLPMNKGQ